MKKKYTTPEIKVIEMTEDIIQTSGEIIKTSAPKTFDGAISVDEQEINIFES